MISLSLQRRQLDELDQLRDRPDGDRIARSPLCAAALTAYLNNHLD